MTTDLHRQRLEAVLAAVRALAAGKVLDLGCGDGDLLLPLLREPQIREVVGIELSPVVLERAQHAVALLSPALAAKASLRLGSMTDLDPDLSGFDVAVLSETIEHIRPDQLSKLERMLFHRLRPGAVIVTTPNAAFNPLLGVPAHRFRHPDHFFEWDRGKFRTWAEGVAARSGYDQRCSDIAGCHPVLGGASQMAVFRLPDSRKQGHG